MIRCSIDEGGTSDKMKGWIPAYAEKHPSYWTNILGGMTEHCRIILLE